MISGSILWYLTVTNQGAEQPTHTVTTGPVTETVSVSGFVEADNEVELAFPQSGRVTDMYVEQGDLVQAGELLGTIANSGLAAARQAAAANVTQAEAARDELQNGQTSEEAAVTEATVAKARAAWEQTNATELQKVEQARIALFSTGLTARSDDNEDEATPPTITGSYTCTEEGNYTLEAYRSSTDSGYSVRYSGLETGTIPLTTSQPTTLGDCGLSLEFTAGDQYNNSKWTITIPNPDNSSYAALLSAYELAQDQAEQNIQAAKDALTLAEATASRETAAPRVEALLAANAAVSAAQAELSRLDAQLQNYAIYAPFTGTVTDVLLSPGEVARTTPAVTLLANDTFTLVARVPEIDITRIATGQTVTAHFDANPEEPQTGTITFIAPRATEIDGVGYFETNIELATTTNWLRAGLNADVEITISELTDSLRVPKRFVYTAADGTPYVYQAGPEPTQTPITITAEGNNGYVAITGLADGDVLTLPNDN